MFQPHFHYIHAANLPQAYPLEYKNQRTGQRHMTNKNSIRKILVNELISINNAEKSCFQKNHASGENSFNIIKKAKIEIKLTAAYFI